MKEIYRGRKIRANADNAIPMCQCLRLRPFSIWMRGQGTARPVRTLFHVSTLEQKDSPGPLIRPTRNRIDVRIFMLLSCGCYSPGRLAVFLQCYGPVWKELFEMLRSALLFSRPSTSLESACATVFAAWNFVCR